uniref:Cyclin-dependent protein kinase inhibitor SMR9 n=1 Tax=Cicer arietinum TaxID=3827 RepID=A0A1S2Y6K0_CICAR|nr:cyclin-dependent protein kinase inhibitor SMR9 [Cicer arietinum]
MAPSGSTTSNNIITGTTKTARSKTTQPGRTRYKKKKQKQEMIKTVSPSRCSSISSQDSSSKEEKMEIVEVTNNNSACSTPKGQRFRIPEISTCPPAPKKQRVLSNCSLKRSPLSFFVPPDLDHFFLVKLPDVSV